MYYITSVCPSLISPSTLFRNRSRSAWEELIVIVEEHYVISKYPGARYEKLNTLTVTLNLGFTEAGFC